MFLDFLAVLLDGEMVDIHVGLHWTAVEVVMEG